MHINDNIHYGKEFTPPLFQSLNLKLMLPKVMKTQPSFGNLDPLNQLGEYFHKRITTQNIVRDTFPIVEIIYI